MRNTTIIQEPMEISEPVVDVLEEGLLHKIMVVFHIPTRWPGWVLGLIGIFVAAAAGLLWRRVTGDISTAQTVGLLQGLFLGADMALLLSLPRLKISFGPWKAQFVVLALPRLLATAVLSLIASWLGAGWGLGLFLVVQLVATAALIWGAMVEPSRLNLSELMVFSDRLPLGTDPIQVLHITDLHVERLAQREERVLALVEEANPDLIVISGDYVNLSYNRDPETLAQVRHLLSQLAAPYGVYATLGSPPVDLRETVVPLFDGLPISLLRHGWQHVDLDSGRELVIMGMDCTHYLPTDEARLAQLAAAVPQHVPQLFLYHSPELMPQATDYGVDLYLCGHTHGGQVRLPWIGPLLTSSQLGRRFVMGLYKDGRTHLYVSRGIGLEGLSAPRVRFKCPPEMTLVTIMPSG